MRFDPGPPPLNPTKRTTWGFAIHDQGPGARHRTEGAVAGRAVRRPWTLRSAPSCASDSRDLHDTLQMTTVLVTHDQEEAMEVANRLAVINHGRLEQVGTPADCTAIRPTSSS